MQKLNLNVGPCMKIFSDRCLLPISIASAWTDRWEMYFLTGLTNYPLEPSFAKMPYNEKKKKYKKRGDEMKNNVVEYFWNYNKTIKIHNCEMLCDQSIFRQRWLYIKCSIFVMSSFVSSLTPLHPINKGERCVFMTRFCFMLYLPIF